VITLQFALELDAGRRRAGGASGDQRRGEFPAGDTARAAVYAKVNPAYAPSSRSHQPRTMPLPEVQNLIDTRLAQKDLAASPAWAW